MASDIPPQGWGSSAQMARALATYIDCPHRILSILRENFNSANFPKVETIRRYRQEYLNPKPEPDAQRFHPIDAYYHSEASARLDARNARFLQRLEIEKALSARKKAQNHESEAA